MVRGPSNDDSPCGSGAPRGVSGEQGCSGRARSSADGGTEDRDAEAVGPPWPGHLAPPAPCGGGIADTRSTTDTRGDRTGRGGPPGDAPALALRPRAVWSGAASRRALRGLHAWGRRRGDPGIDGMDDGRAPALLALPPAHAAHRPGSVRRPVRALDDHPRQGPLLLGELDLLPLRPRDPHGRIVEPAAARPRVRPCLPRTAHAVERRKLELPPDLERVRGGIRRGSGLYGHERLRGAVLHRGGLLPRRRALVFLLGQLCRGVLRFLQRRLADLRGLLELREGRSRPPSAISWQRRR